MTLYHPNSGALIALSLKTDLMDSAVIFPIKTYNYDMNEEPFPVRSRSSIPFEDVLEGFRTLKFDCMGYVMKDFDPFDGQAKIKLGSYADAEVFTENGVRSATARILITHWVYSADEDGLIEFHLGSVGNWHFATFKDVD